MQKFEGPLNDRLAALRDGLKPLLRTADGRSDTTDIWQEIIDIQNFVFDLEAESLKRIRLHTHLFTSYAPRTFVRLRNDEYTPDRYPPVGQYQFYTESLDEDLWLSEPPLPGCAMPSGYAWKGRHINPDVVRYQSCVSNLQSSGVFDRVVGQTDPWVLEVGGGFGGLAEGLFRVVPQVPLTYVVLDLAELLIFSGAHVVTHHPDIQLYLCDRPEDVAGLSTLPPGRRLVLLPTTLNDALSGLPELQLVVAMASFQEMSVKQILDCSDVLSSRCAGYLYSDNTEAHPDNVELSGTGLSTLLERHWCLYPDRGVYEQLRDGRSTWFHRPYLGVSRTAESVSAPTGLLRFIGGDYKKGRKYYYHFEANQVVEAD